MQTNTVEYNSCQYEGNETENKDKDEIDFTPPAMIYITFEVSYSMKYTFLVNNYTQFKMGSPGWQCLLMRFLDLLLSFCKHQCHSNIHRPGWIRRDREVLLGCLALVWSQAPADLAKIYNNTNCTPCWIEMAFISMSCSYLTYKSGVSATWTNPLLNVQLPVDRMERTQSIQIEDY